MCERRDIRGEAASCQLPEGRPHRGDGGPGLHDPRAEWNGRLPPNPVGGAEHQESTLGGEEQVCFSLSTFSYSVDCFVCPSFYHLFLLRRLKERLVEERMDANMDPKDNNATQLVQKCENEKQTLKDELEVERIKDALGKELQEFREELKKKDEIISVLEHSNTKLCSDIENVNNESNRRENEVETLQNAEKQCNVKTTELRDELK